MAPRVETDSQRRRMIAKIKKLARTVRLDGGAEIDPRVLDAKTLVG